MNEVERSEVISDSLPQADLEVVILCYRKIATHVRVWLVRVAVPNQVDSKNPESTYQVVSKMHTPRKHSL